MIIRKANQKDLDDIIKFNCQMAKETENKDLELNVISSGVKRLFNNPEYGFYLVAETGGKVVACLMITYEWTDWRDGLFWWVQSVYVRPEFRKQGIYRKMYDYVKELAAKEKEVVGFRLYVEKENIIAQKVYEELGMELTNYKMYEELK